MAKPRKPQRSDSRFPRGLKGDRMYQLALEEYNRAASGNLSITDKLFSMSDEAKAARRRAANRLLGRYRDGQIVVKGGKKFRWNAKTKQFVPVKPQPRGMSNIPPKEADAPVNVEARKPKPKPKPDQPAAAQPKPKPKPKPQPKTETVDGKTVKRVGPVSTPADKPKMNKLKIEKATASTEKAYLKYLQEQAKKKSLEQAKENRARGRRPRGPRDRY